MSCPGDNYPVPGANPCGGGGGGVQSVGAGTPNVTITGTPSDPLINVTNLGGVTQVEGQIGNVNLNGVGMTITGGSPTPGDVTFTANVQYITGSGSATVTQPTTGIFNVAVPTATVTNITAGGGIAVTQPTTGTFNIASQVQNIVGVNNAQVLGIAGVYAVNVPFPTVTNITGSGEVTVTQPTAGTFNIDVPGTTVSNITGTGVVTVTNPTPGTFNVGVPTTSLGVLTVGAGNSGITIGGTPQNPTVGLTPVVVPTNTLAWDTANTNLSISPNGSTVHLTFPVNTYTAPTPQVTQSGTLTQVNFFGAYQVEMPNGNYVMTWTMFLPYSQYNFSAGGYLSIRWYNLIAPSNNVLLNHQNFYVGSPNTTTFNNWMSPNYDLTTGWRASGTIVLGGYQGGLTTFPNIFCTLDVNLGIVVTGGTGATCSFNVIKLG